MNDIISIIDSGRKDGKHIYTIEADILDIQKMIDNNQGKQAIKIISEKVIDFFTKKIVG